MSVTLNPSSSLGFNRPFTQHVKRSLTITNHNSQPVAFKIKTTAPKLYCVRPNAGKVEAGGTAEIQITLQAMKEEPTGKCKDKFLVMSTLLTPEMETIPLSDIWGSQDSESVFSHRIKIVYLPPEGMTVPEEDEGVSGMAAPLPEKQPAPEGAVPPPDSRYDTARGLPPAEANGHPRDLSMEEGVTAPHEEEEHHDASDISRLEPQLSQTSAPPPEVAVPDDEVRVQVDVHPPQPPVAAPAPAPAPVASTPAVSAAPSVDPSADLTRQLDAAHAEIERLRALISSMPDPSTEPSTFTSTETELRRRHRPLSDDGTTTYDGETEVGTFVEDAVGPQEGVPLQVVIIIAISVFFTTYLFF